MAEDLLNIHSTLSQVCPFPHPGETHPRPVGIPPEPRSPWLFFFYFTHELSLLLLLMSFWFKQYPFHSNHLSYMDLYSIDSSRTWNKPVCLLAYHAGYFNLFGRLPLMGGGGGVRNTIKVAACMVKYVHECIKHRFTFF